MSRKTFYGVRSTEDAAELARHACMMISPKTAHQAIPLVIGSGCAETALGQTRDNYLAQGRGIVQLDEVRFLDIRDYVLRRRPHLNKLCIQEFNFDFNSIGFGIVLDHSPLLCFVICRIGYMMKEPPLPHQHDLYAQAGYWKDHWNSNAKNAAGTREHYMKAWRVFTHNEGGARVYNGQNLAADKIKWSR